MIPEGSKAEVAIPNDSTVQEEENLRAYTRCIRDWIVPTNVPVGRQLYRATS
jgi:hypothetical protein